MDKKDWMFVGAVFFVAGLIWFRTALFVIVALGLIGWLVWWLGSRMFLRLPEGTAAVVGNQVFLNYQDHCLDSQGNVIPCPGARHQPFRWLGLSGIFADRKKVRVILLDNKGNLKDRVTEHIPVRGLGMQVPVIEKTGDGKKVEALFAVKVRVDNPLAVAVNWDWAQRVRNEVWAHGGAAIGRRQNITSLSGAREQVCSLLLNKIRLEHIQLEEVMITQVSEKK